MYDTCFVLVVCAHDSFARMGRYTEALVGKLVPLLVSFPLLCRFREKSSFTPGGPISPCVARVRIEGWLSDRMLMVWPMIFVGLQTSPWYCAVSVVACEFYLKPHKEHAVKDGMKTRSKLAGGRSPFGA